MKWADNDFIVRLCLNSSQPSLQIGGLSNLLQVVIHLIKSFALDDIVAEEDVEVIKYQ